MTVSILRGPEVPAALLEPHNYVAYNYHGMRDHGTHTYRYALYLGVGNLLEEPLQPLARHGDDFLLAMKPWKIVTVRLLP